MESRSIKRFVVHIGRAKTGTTALQQVLQDHSERLATAGLGVPTLFDRANHAELAAAYSERPGRIAARFGADTAQGQADLRRRIRADLTALGPGTWLLTNEHLAERLRTEGEVGAFLVDLTAVADEVHVIGVVRRPAEAIPSAYAESLVAGWSWDLDEEYVQSNTWFWDLGAFVRRWSIPVPGVELGVLPYRSLDTVSDVLAAVSRIAGLPDPVVLPAPHRSNASMSAGALRHLRDANAAGLEPSARRRLVEALRPVTGPPLPLTPAAWSRLVDLELTRGGLDALIPASDSEGEVLSPLRPGDWTSWGDPQEPDLAEWPPPGAEEQRQIDEALRAMGSRKA